jgi:hypothetical protein
MIPEFGLVKGNKMAKKQKYAIEADGTPSLADQAMISMETVAVEVTATPKVKAPKLGYHVSLNGVGYLFAKRDPLKKEHAGSAATICGVEGTVVIIPAREFADNRVWVTLPNGDTGRFLVPKEVDLTGELVIDVVEGSIEYKREDLRVRPKVERKKAEKPAEAQPAEAPAEA